MENDICPACGRKFGATDFRWTDTKGDTAGESFCLGCTLGGRDVRNTDINMNDHRHFYQGSDNSRKGRSGHRGRWD